MFSLSVNVTTCCNPVAPRWGLNKGTHSNNNSENIWGIQIFINLTNNQGENRGGLNILDFMNNEVS